jgi:putative acyl-CoA dehydrogenase
MKELHKTKGENSNLDQTIVVLQKELNNSEQIEVRARRITELLALSMQASLLIQHNTGAVANAFCESRLGGQWGHAFGTLQDQSVFSTLLQRATPKIS